MITEISDNFYCITLPMPFRLKHVHIYALVQEKEAVLFDTGFNISGSYEMLEHDLESIGLSIKSIRDIFITHTHTDHCSMASLIQGKSGAKIHLSRAAYEFYRNYFQAALLERQGKLFYSLHGMSPKEIEAVFAVFGAMRQILGEFKADTYLQQNEIREFGERKFEVIFTPGHAIGHVCFFFRKEGLLLSGDHILPQITPNLSPDVFNDNFHPLKSFLDSLEVIEALPIKRVYPGHGIFFTGLKERLEEIRKHHKERTQLIINCLNAKPKTTYTISQEIFGRSLPDFDKFLALNETYVHLLELKLNGTIREIMDGKVLAYTAC